MPRFDLPPDELRSFGPDIAEPDDFDAFWRSTLDESRALAHPPRLDRVDSPLTQVDAYDVEFSGFGGDPVKAWFLLPAGTASSARLPAVVEYLGYGGGRGLPHERLAWAASGYAHLVMDTRGQGSAWGTGGGTPDPHGSGPATPGFMTRGVEAPETYYYRRLITDAALAVDAVRALPSVDPDRVAVTGISQGGGLALAAAGLVDGLVGAMSDVPFLCCFERAVGLTDRDPYHEIERYLRVHRGAESTVFRTLSYIDGVNFAKRATAPALVSVALMDPVCPPSTVYAAVNHHAVGADVVEYGFNEHEGGLAVQWEVQAAWLAARLRELDGR